MDGHGTPGWVRMPAPSLTITRGCVMRSSDGLAVPALLDRSSNLKMASAEPEVQWTVNDSPFGIGVR